MVRDSQMYAMDIITSFIITLKGLRCPPYSDAVPAMQTVTRSRSRSREAIQPTWFVTHKSNRVVCCEDSRLLLRRYTMKFE